MPVFSATKSYVIVEPAARVSVVVFVSVISGVAVADNVTASESDTVPPPGGVPTTEASLVRLPESTSDWVAVYSNWQDVVSPGANVAAGQEPTTLEPDKPSEIWTPVNVTLPVFSATRSYVIVAPADRVSEVVLVSVIPGVAVADNVTASESDTVPPPGGEPTTEASLVRLPESTSDWVAVYSNWQLVVSVGARVTAGQDPTTDEPLRASEICTSSGSRCRCSPRQGHR